MNESVVAAKILTDFMKKNPKLVVKAGYVDGDYYVAEEIKQIAALPNRQTLLTMLASSLLAPLHQLAVGLDLIANKENN